MMAHGGHDDSERAAQARLCMESPEAFFRNYWPRLLNFLISQASDSELAEEAAADAFTAALDNWDKLLLCRRPDSWLFKVGIRRLRRLEEQARARSCLNEDLASYQADLQATSETNEWVADNLDLITALRCLPRRQSEAIALKWLGDYTIKETSQLLGVTEGTVKKQLNRAIEKLRVLLDDPAVTDIARRNSA
jgi:RNA polymerase sigma-70 factor (ECF subfamily)